MSDELDNIGLNADECGVLLLLRTNLRIVLGKTKVKKDSFEIDLERVLRVDLKAEFTLFLKLPELFLEESRALTMLHEETCRQRPSNRVLA